MKKHNQLHPKSAELLKILKDLVDEFAYTEGNLPRKQIDEELYETLGKALSQMEDNGVDPEDIGREVLIILARQQKLSRLFINALEDYVFGFMAKKSHEESLASGEKNISLEDLKVELGIE